MDARCRALSGLAAIALVCGSTTAPSAQAECTREGDRLICPDGEREVVGPESDARPPFGSWRGWPGPRRSDEGRDGLTDEPRVHGSDGRICWPHGDHVHCR